MKFNFKRIAAILTSALMMSSSAGLALAANYPTPFVQNGAADVAVVYGASGAQTDLVAAADIQGQLAQ
jgi:S-layer protein (TIGR01564 family)